MHGLLYYRLRVKEILAGIREVGILEMEIYILGTRLFMIVETPLDFDWDTAMERLNSAKEGTSSYYYKYLVDENAGTFKLADYDRPGK